MPKPTTPTMLITKDIVRSPIDFRPNDTITIEGVFMRVDRVIPLTANLTRVEGNSMSFSQSVVLSNGNMMRVMRTVSS